MPNKLEKTVLPSGGVGGSSGGGGGGGGGGGNSGGLKEGTPCFQAIAARISELWPLYVSVYQPEANRFYVSLSGSPIAFYITGSCSGGYVSLQYVQSTTHAYPLAD